MDTKTDIYSSKRVVGVEVLDLDITGYGPEGKHTRKAWRNECKDKLLAGKSQFESWQNSWKYTKHNSLPDVHLGITLHYADGTCTQSRQHTGFKPYALDFSGQIFDEAVSAYEYLFDNYAYFDGATFKKNANFHKAKFNEYTDFGLALFEGTTDFRKTSFADYALFNDVIFVYYVTLNETVFHSGATFSGATFRENAIFNDASFNKGAHFTNTTFEQTASFRLVVFGGDANFKGAWFLGEAQFFKAQFLNQCRFDVKLGELNEMYRWIELHRYTQFNNLVNFENTKIENVGHFEGVCFKGECPNFLGVDNAKTLLVFSGDEYFNKDDTNGNATDRIAQLKRLADEQGQTDQMLMFNAFELNAKAKQPGASRLLKIFTWLYDKVSDYGRSFGRPLLTYLGLISITYILALFAAANNSPQDCKGELWRVFSDWRNNGYSSCISYELPDDKFKLNGYRAAFEYTTYRAAGILDFSDNDKQTVAVAKRLFNADVEPTWMRFWGIFKAIASTALLFLAALGLRNKYRIK